MFEVICEEIWFLVKTFVWHFKSDHRQLERLYLLGLMRKSCPPNRRLRAQPVCGSPRRDFWRGLRPPCQSHSSHVCFPSPGAFIPGHLYLWLWAQIFRSLCRGLLTGRKWEEESIKLKYTFPPSAQYFPLLALPLCHLVNYKVHKMAWVFCSRPLQHLDHPHIWASTWPSPD